MSFEVVWLERAEEDLFSTINYLKETFGLNIAEKFKQRVEKNIKLISEMPKIFPVIDEKRRIRKCIIVKQISLYYLEIEINEEVIIIRLLDNRMNPEKIEEELDI